MSFATAIGFIAAFAAFGTAVWVFVRWGQSFVSLTLIAGLVLAGLEAGFGGMSQLAESSEELLRWQYLAILATTLQPGVWLLFVLSFGRAGYERVFARLKWLLTIVFIFPLVLTVLFEGQLVRAAVVLDPGWIAGLGWAGRVFYLFLLLSAVAILMQLERTFRASAGTIRWEMKFLVIGVGTLWAVRIYTSSQALLFSSVSAHLELISLTFLIIACLSISLSVWRTHAVTPNHLYLSQNFVYNSLVALSVGVYLIIVGLFAKVMSHVGEVASIPLDSFVLFVALIGLTVVLLSDTVRQRTKKLIALQLGRPQFDYRKVWTDFTHETSALLEEGPLAASVTRLIARTLGVSSAGIWLWDEGNRMLRLVHGTFSPKNSEWHIASDLNLGQLAAAKPEPADIRESKGGWPEILRKSCSEDLLPAYVTHAIPLVVSGNLLGFLTVNGKLTGEPLLPDELELFRTLSEQTAASLSNVRMSKELTAAREAEAFQRMSTFLVHDLKNLASSLSLTVNNLPRHFDNPEFRADALKSIKRSVDKMNAMCGRLGSLRSVPSLVKEECDLNSLVEATIGDLNGVQRWIDTDLGQVRKVWVDDEEVRKVVQNLILNGVEASGNKEKIVVKTEERDASVIVSITDKGCGMSQEFIHKELFRPFTSTKEKGLGIGLFQCRQIVDAHGGRIEVESEEGKGSTFRVYFPAA